MQIAGMGAQALVGEGFEPELVERIGGIRDQLPQEDLPVGID